MKVIHPILLGSKEFHRYIVFCNERSESVQCNDKHVWLVEAGIFSNIATCSLPFGMAKLLKG